MYIQYICIALCNIIYISVCLKLFLYLQKLKFLLTYFYSNVQNSKNYGTE